jgi:hypothetical protein
MDDFKAQSDAGKRQAKPVISPEEIERRRHVRTADADLRIEGFPSDALTEKIGNYQVAVPRY